MKDKHLIFIIYACVINHLFLPSVDGGKGCRSRKGKDINQ